MVSLLATVGCGSPVDADEAGADVSGDPLVVVGERVLTSEDVAKVHGQLGRYAQGRFSGEEGRRLLLESLIETEVLAQAAVDGGLGDDPRVAWALVEEMAALALAAELERRVPESEISSDQARLRAYYDAHPEEFLSPERRSMRGVRFDDLVAADQAHTELVNGRATLESLGEVLSTPLERRDDEHSPGAHPLLFDETLETGELLDAPVLLGRHVLVARVGEIESPRARPFSDPEVQAEIVEKIRRPLLAKARTAYLDELEQRYGAPGAAPR